MNIQILWRILYSFICVQLKFFGDIKFVFEIEDLSIPIEKQYENKYYEIKLISMKLHNLQHLYFISLNIVNTHSECSLRSKKNVQLN